MNKEQLFHELYESKLKEEAYIDSIPSDISTAFVDNEYANSISVTNEKLIKYIFGDSFDSILWFLYEWKPGYKVGSNGKITTIHSIDDYITWMKEFEGFLNDI